MRDESGCTDEELAAAAAGGDPVAYDALARRHLRPAVALALQITRRLEDAEDVAQEAFHRMVRALADYDPGRAFAPWFYTIVRNVGRSHVEGRGRRRRLLPVESLAEDPPAAAGAADHGARGRDLHRALAVLPEMQRLCVRLCHLEGFTSREAGAMLGISEGTVRTHLHRARGSLRELLGEARTGEVSWPRGAGSE